MAFIPPGAGLQPTGSVVDNRLAREFQDRLLEAQTTLFDKAATYSNLIIAAGYAGGFTLWGNVADHLSPNTHRLVGMLLAVSLFFFIAYQIYKIFSYVLHFIRIRSLARARLEVTEFFSRLNNHDRRMNRNTLRVGTVMAGICLPICIVTAVTAFGLVVYDAYDVLNGSAATFEQPV